MVLNDFLTHLNNHKVLQEKTKPTAPNNLYLVEANYTEADIQDRIAEKKINGEYVYEKRVMREHLSKEKADDWLCANMAAYSEYIYMHGHQEKDN